MPDGLLRISEVAAMLGVSRWTVRRWILDGVMPARMIGNRWYVRREVAEGFMLPPEPEPE